MEQLILFIAGFVLEIIATIDVIAVQKRQALLSGCMTFIMVGLGYAVFYNIIILPDAYLNIFANGLGAGVGGFITIIWNKK